MAVAETLCDRIFMIFKGRKVLDGTLDQIQSVSTHACPSCSGPLVTAVPAVLTDATQIATGPWATTSTDGGLTGHHDGTPGSGPELPQVGGNLPPGSVVQWVHTLM